MSAPRRILVYRSGALGDTIVALPAIQAVREGHPDAELVLMTATDGSGIVWTDQVVRDLRWFARVVTYRARELMSPIGLLRVLGRVRAESPDLVLYLASDHNAGIRRWRDRAFFRLAGVRRFVAATSSKVTFFGHLRREAREYPYESDRLLDAAYRAGGVRPTQPTLPAVPAAVERARTLLAARAIGVERPFVAMCPGSKQAAKRWPLERYAALGARLIRDGGVDVVIVGGSDEAHAAAEVARDWQAGRWTVVAGACSVLESAEVLRRACLYVGNDTGAMHLAAAVGTPCVGIFAAREPGLSWHPYGEGHVVLRRDEVPCANCYLMTCTVERLRCLTAIDVDTVWAACRPKLPARRAA